jgi:hypothetical protein
MMDHNTGLHYLTSKAPKEKDQVQAPILHSTSLLNEDISKVEILI